MVELNIILIYHTTAANCNRALFDCFRPINLSSTRKEHLLPACWSTYHGLQNKFPWDLSSHQIWRVGTVEIERKIKLCSFKSQRRSVLHLSCMRLALPTLRSWAPPKWTPLETRLWGVFFIRQMFQSFTPTTVIHCNVVALQHCPYKMKESMKDGQKQWK